MYNIFKIQGGENDTPEYQYLVHFMFLEEAQQYAQTYARNHINNQNTACHIINEARHTGDHTFVGSRNSILNTRYCPHGHFGGILIEEC